MLKHALTMTLLSSKVLSLEQPGNQAQPYYFNLEARTTEPTTPDFITPVLQATIGWRYCQDPETGQFIVLAERFSPSLHVDNAWSHGSTRDSDTHTCSLVGGYAIETQDVVDTYLVHDSNSKTVMQLEGPCSVSMYKEVPNGGREGDHAQEGGDVTTRLFASANGGIIPRCRDLTKSARNAGRELRPTALSATVDPEPWAGPDSTTTTSTLYCDTAWSPPSLVPEALFVGPTVDGTNYNLTPTYVAEVDSRSSTIFQFALTEPFRSPLPLSNGSVSGRCGLQFRLPVCSQLPPGYPCYQFSGIEQEVLRKSGMRFSPAAGSPQLQGWRTLPVVQVWPGEDTLVGTFDCRLGVRGPDGEKASWLAESVNGFGLRFVQAGGGGYVDGVGLFVVACL